MLCPKCKSKHVHRKQRAPEERWKYAAVYECYDCQHRVGVSHLKQLPKFSLPRFLEWPWISFHARCPRCGNTKLRVQRRRDWVEGYHESPLRTIEKLLGAPLCYCWDCRLQFHDLRPRGRSEG